MSGKIRQISPRLKPASRLATHNGQVGRGDFQDGAKALHGAIFFLDHHAYHVGKREHNFFSSSSVHNRYSWYGHTNITDKYEINHLTEIIL